MSYKRCYAEVSLPAIRRNLTRIKEKAGTQKKLLTVVKANAYGHGSIEVARAVNGITDLFGVACAEEALELRSAGISKPILILGYTSPSQYRDLVSSRISAAIYDPEDAMKLNEAAKTAGLKASVHIACDTGMTRIGLRSREESARLIAQIAAMPHISVDGIFTHFSCADEFDPASEAYTKMQLAEFEFLLDRIEQQGIRIPLIHAYNSAAIIRQESRRFTCVRSGLITYGMYPCEGVKEMFPGLQPALSWTAHVIHVAQAESGRGVSYGATYFTSRPLTKIATVSAGYADGFPRSLSNKGSVIINGHKAPIIGRVCMDQFMVDATEIPDVKKEDRAILIGEENGVRILADDIAALDHTINYEVTCRISPRVERIYT